MIPTAASFIGLVGGGVLTDMLFRRNFRPRFARGQGPALCIAIGIPFLIAGVLSSSGGVSVACFAIYLLDRAAGHSRAWEGMGKAGFSADLMIWSASVRRRGSDSISSVRSYRGAR